MFKRKSSDKRPKNFWDRIARKYSRDPIKDMAAYEHKLKMAQEYFRPDMSILELGCGTGSTAILHAPHVKHIQATDLSENMLEIAKSKVADAGIENISFQQTTVEDIQIEAESIDAVLTMSLLHLLKDKRQAMQKIYTMLKSDGLFISSTVCLSELNNPIKYIVPLGHKIGLLPFVKAFSKDQLIDSIAQGGFKIEYVWQPKKGAAVFVIARKVEDQTSV